LVIYDLIMLARKLHPYYQHGVDVAVFVEFPSLSYIKIYKFSHTCSRNGIEENGFECVYLRKLVYLHHVCTLT